MERNEQMCASPSQAPGAIKAIAGIQAPIRKHVIPWAQLIIIFSQGDLEVAWTYGNEHAKLWKI